ncbi:MAG: hypothetical protein ACKVWV_13435 [Planctomycetota bacterium]
MHLRIAWTSTLATLCASVASAGVTVIPPGSPFSALIDAVAVAQDGDVILVKGGGPYQGPVVIDGKALTLVSEQGPAVTINSRLGVTNLPAGKVVVVSGFTINGGSQGSDNPAPSSPSGAGIYVFDCAGSVRVLSCTLNGGNGSVPKPGGHAAKVRNSPDVAFSNCTMTGGKGAGGGMAGNGGDGGHGLYCENAFVALYDGVLAGREGGSGGFSAGDGGHGARVFLGRGLFAADSTFTGANAGHNNCCEDTSLFCQSVVDFPGPLAGIGGSGVRVESRARAHLLGNAYAGGLGGTVSCPFPGPGSDGVGLNGAPSDVFTFPAQPRALVAPRTVREGASASITITGDPGDEVRLLVQPNTGFVEVLGWRGVLLSYPATPGPACWKQLGTIPSSGALTHTLAVGELGPGVQQETWHVQALVKSPAFGYVLTSYRTLTMLDSAL